MDNNEIKQILWRRGDLKWKLHSGQQQIYDALACTNETEFYLNISRQWGKSYLSCILALEYLLRGPNRIARIAAPTRLQAAEIVELNLNRIIEDAPKGLIQRQKSDYRWQVGQSSLRLGSLEKANVDSLRGGNAGLIICEEGGFVNSKDYQDAVESVLSAQLLRSRGRIIHVSTPSRQLDHYLHTQILPSCSRKGTLFTFTIYQNPQVNEEQINQMAALCGGFDTASFKREYLCKIERDIETAVLPAFNSSCIGPSVIQPSLVSLDLGGVRDLSVAVEAGWNVQEQRLEVIREVVWQPHTPSQAIFEYLLECQKIGLQVWCDAPGQWFVDANKFGVNAFLPPKSEWLGNLLSLNAAFHQGHILVSENCTHLIRTCQNARFNNQKTDFERSTELGHADAIMALAYAFRVINRTPRPKALPNMATTWVPPHLREEAGVTEVAKLFNLKRR